MTSDEIRNYPIEVTCDVMTDQVAPQVNGCAFFLREIAAQLSDLNKNIKLLAPKCPRCDGTGWICIHCDKNLTECQCPDDGSRNPGSCDKCGVKEPIAPQEITTEPEYLDDIPF